MGMGFACWNLASWRTVGVQTEGTIDGGRRSHCSEPRETVYCAWSTLRAKP